MNFCSKCGTQLPEGATTCPNCGNAVNSTVQLNDTDHTAEFDAKDISDNKVMAMLCYLMGIGGVILCLLGANQSAYAAFHVRQCLKITVCEVLLVIITALLCWTIIVPIAGGVCIIILLVVRIICFFDICKGKAKEPAIVSKFNFLK